MFGMHLNDLDEAVFFLDLILASTGKNKKIRDAMGHLLS